MRIRTRLFLGFGALIFLMFALAGIGISQLNRMDGSLKEIYEYRYAKVNLAKNTQVQFYEMSKTMVEMVLSDQTANYDTQLQRLNGVQADAGNSYAKLTAQRPGESISPAEKEMFDKVGALALDFGRYQTKFLDYIKAGNVAEARKLQLSEGSRLIDSLNKTFEDISQYNEDAMQSAFSRSSQTTANTMTMTIILTSIGLLLGLGIMFWIIYSITGGLNVVSRMIADFSDGKVDPVMPALNATDEIGTVAVSFHGMALDLLEKTAREEELSRQREEQNWLNTNVAETTMMLQGINDLQELSQSFISEVTPKLGANYGALYLKEGEGRHGKLKLLGSYAHPEGAAFNHSIRIGEGLVGQAALDEKSILLTELPADYVKISSGTGQTEPVNLLIHPVLHDGRVAAVVELASLRAFSELEQELLDQLCRNIGIQLNTITGRNRIEELLRISQQLTEELQSQSEELLSQQEELRASNDKLEDQTRSLKISEEMLQRQQSELEHSNEELTRQAQALEIQIRQTEQTNRQIEQTKAALERQALQLALTSKYKSEFLANMSHELRTPLNSLLILSQLLADNKDGNLSERQVEFASTINASGHDLLKLIDEILDLSKIEAGKMAVNLEHLPLRSLKEFALRNYMPVAKKNGVEFTVAFDGNLPETIYTDDQRLKQILKNLLSNAFKFTKEGSVELAVAPSRVPEKFRETFAGTDSLIAISVKDTGIGIPEDKQDLIFEAFQQADGTTSRKYGGTGLGLSISRELAGLIGGVIDLESKEDEGSKFTLYLPESHAASLDRMVNEAEAFQQTNTPRDGAGVHLAADIFLPNIEMNDPSLMEPSEIEDDRESIKTGDKLLLVIEDDPSFARIILEMGRIRGFKVIVAMRGDKGLALAQNYKPDAIILDIQLPVMDGWSILNHLKQNIATRHIPVHVISVIEENQQLLSMGAIAFLKKPASRGHLEDVFSQIESFIDRRLKKLLIVEDDPELRKSLVELIGHDDVAITAVATGKEALNELARQRYDCMVLDLILSDVSGFDLLDQIHTDGKLRDLPIIIYTGKNLDAKEEVRLKQYADSIIIKNVKSPERLFEETALFLHRVEADLPEDKRRLLEQVLSNEEAFDGKSILLVDDDIRNVFALSSILESCNLKITFAENGREALELLEKPNDYNLILMDIMMPEMDGYETMRAIRSMPEYRQIPIIALTAKAMREDRSKCIDAGASDYITKPINTDQLLSLLRVWLYK